MDYAALSLWHATAGDDLTPRVPLQGSADYDVAIVGGGYTGLWTAYYLKRADPSLRIAILEREICGFGASGRNGGWCSALFPTSWKRLVAASGEDGARRMHRAMTDTVREIGDVLDRERIDAHYRRGGTVSVARSEPQLLRLREEVGLAHRRGFTEDDIRLLDRDEASAHLHATHVIGGAYTPHCAAVHPARLARGLADVVADLGVDVFERTPVTAIEPHRAVTEAGTVKADVVVRATEAFTAALPTHRRTIAPVYSLMVATEPLADATWDQIGLRDRQTFNDGRHVIVYGQRTADGRLVFGGRGAPYHFASRVSPDYDREPRVFAMLRTTLTELLPAVASVEFTHAWGGPLGIARDWAASVGLDHKTGLAWAGGYVGDGVSTTNLAGRTLRDLILASDSDLTTLPWVNHRSRRWEPEPLRWIGINGGLRAMTLADLEEGRTHRESRIARAMAPLIHG